MPNDMEAALPTRADMINAAGAELFTKGELEPARMHFLATLQIEPNHPQALQNLGAVLRSMRFFAAAASVARRSVAASPGNPFAQSNLAVSLLHGRKYSDALEIMRGVIRQMPNNPLAQHNMGLIFYMMGRTVEALTCFDRSIVLGNTNPAVFSDRALAILTLGEIARGLEAYECRWAVLRKNQIWALGIPEWCGEDLKGASLLVHHEQGFGDSIMLSRFLAKLPAETNVTLAVPEELVRLFYINFGHRAKVIDIRHPSLQPYSDEQTPHFTYHTPMLSLMRHVGVSTAADIDASPYLFSEKLDREFNLPKAKFHVGLVWASGDHSIEQRERRRVTNVLDWLKLTELPDVAVISLQVGPPAKDIEANGLNGLIFDTSFAIEDFASTAQIISRLDLVISVDSAVLHLAAAMGKPTIMLGPFTRCWRWWGADTGAPWYDQMRIYRQSSDGSWSIAISSAIANVRKRLRDG